MTTQIHLNPLHLLKKIVPPLLKVEDLHVSFSLHGHPVQAVRGVSFSVSKGESVGIVGESGCGKSAAVQAITRLTQATKVEGKALFEGRDLLVMSEREIRSYLGKKIGMVFQDPMTSLNPTMKIGWQLMEPLLIHRLADKGPARQKALELLQLVGVPEPAIRLTQYPHELSGGMRQRVLLAIALICNPSLLIADEPTTALDGTIQAQILDLIKKIQRHFQMGLLLITHDLRIVSEVCDRVLVFYAGKIVEQGSVEDVLETPRHPYTQMLLQSIPRLDRPKSKALQGIDGSPPSPLSPPKGCAFAARCPYVMKKCEEPPPFFGSAACWRHAP